MTKILLILIIFGIVSCNFKEDTSNVIIKEDSVNLMNQYPELRNRIDKAELTPSNNFYKLIIATDSTCNIEWGNDTINRITTTDYNFNIARRFNLDWENGEFLVLKTRTGSDAWFNLVLPIDKEADEFIINNPLTKDKQRNLIVAEHLAGTDSVMSIYNLRNKKRQYIVDNVECEAAFYHSCLDTLMLMKEHLYYKWSLPNKYDDNPRNIDRNVQIKI